MGKGSGVERVHASSVTRYRGSDYPGGVSRASTPTDGRSLHHSPLCIYPIGSPTSVLLN